MAVKAVVKGILSVLGGLFTRPPVGVTGLCRTFQTRCVSGLQLCVWHELASIAAICECRSHLIKWMELNLRGSYC